MDASCPSSDLDLWFDASETRSLFSTPIATCTRPIENLSAQDRLLVQDHQPAERYQLARDWSRTRAELPRTKAEEIGRELPVEIASLVVPMGSLHLILKNKPQGSRDANNFRVRIFRSGILLNISSQF